MIIVYEANTSFDAKLIQDQLSLAGIESNIVGDLLQGGIGEVQTQGLVKVMCNNEDYDKARVIITEWESKKPIKEQGQNKHLLKKMKTSSFTKTLLLFFMFLFLIGLYLFFNIIRYFFF